MKFLRLQRVRYGTNPLVDVVCEVKFPLQLEIQDALPIEFQKQISEIFPILELKNEVQFEVNFDVEGREQTSEPTVKQTPIVTYNFFSVDRKWGATLAPQSLRLWTQAYSSWEDFEEKFLVLLSSLQRIYSTAYLTRIGLRYRDVIDRKKLGREGMPWAQLIDAQILGPMLTYKIGEPDCIDFQQNLSVKLDVGRVTIKQGFVKHVDDSHYAFLIDTDFHHDETVKAEINYVSGLLRDFNVQAGAVFRSAITDELHGFLQPSPIE